MLSALWKFLKALAGYLAWRAKNLIKERLAALGFWKDESLEIAKIRELLDLADVHEKFPVKFSYGFRRGDEQSFQGMMDAFGAVISLDTDVEERIQRTPTALEIHTNQVGIRLPIEGRADFQPIVIDYGTMAVRRRPLMDAILDFYGPVSATPDDLATHDHVETLRAKIRRKPTYLNGYEAGFSWPQPDGGFSGHEMMAANTTLYQVLLDAGLDGDRVEELLA